MESLKAFLNSVSLPLTRSAVVKSNGASGIMEGNLSIDLKDFSMVLALFLLWFCAMVSLLVLCICKIQAKPAQVTIGIPHIQALLDVLVTNRNEKSEEVSQHELLTLQAQNHYLNTKLLLTKQKLQILQLNEQVSDTLLPERASARPENRPESEAKRIEKKSPQAGSSGKIESTEVEALIDLGEDEELSSETLVPSQKTSSENTSDSQDVITRSEPSSSHQSASHTKNASDPWYDDPEPSDRRDVAITRVPNPQTFGVHGAKNKFSYHISVPRNRTSAGELESPSPSCPPAAPRDMPNFKHISNNKVEDPFAPVKLDSHSPLPLSVKAAGDAAPKLDNGLYSPYAYRYPVHYFPALDVPKEQLLRTVLISGLGSNIGLDEVMKKVRGGLIVSATLVNAVSSPEGKGCVVQFFHSEGAQAYVEFVSMHKAKIFLNDGEGVKVTLLQTPTYPCERWTQDGIARRGWTRHLIFYGIPDTMSLSMIRNKLCPAECTQARDGVVSMWREPRGVGRETEMFIPEHPRGHGSVIEEDGPTEFVHIVFRSVEDGEKGFARLRSHENRRMFAGLKVWWGRDECQGPLEELLQKSTMDETKAEVIEANGSVACWKEAVGISREEDSQLLEDTKIKSIVDPMTVFNGYDDEDYQPATPTDMAKAENAGSVTTSGAIAYAAAADAVDASQHKNNELPPSETIKQASPKTPSTAILLLPEITTPPTNPDEIQLDTESDALSESIEYSNALNTKEETSAKVDIDLLSFNDHDDPPEEPTITSTPSPEGCITIGESLRRFMNGEQLGEVRNPTESERAFTEECSKTEPLAEWLARQGRMDLAIENGLQVDSGGG
ncbi:MAG: hypothetical protein M1820_006486 [Bogoriella megaspora]|nr:MAG: hypothetical protein M1820_006486 [Bogoriella megaspora]